MALSHPRFGLPRLGVSPSFGRKILQATGRLFEVFRVRQIPVTINDVRLTIDPRDYWSLRAYLFSPTYDLKEIAAVEHFIPREYEFIDVGANFGAWAFTLARHFSRVIAVEPDIRCFDCLLLTASRGHLQNVSVIHAALSDRDGDGRLFPLRSFLGDGRIYHPGDEGRMDGRSIQLISFDTLVERYHIDAKRLFIKLDTQGAEPWIIRGMEETLGRADDVILWSEVTDFTLRSAGSSVDQYLGLLKDLGFAPVDLFDGLRETSWDITRDSRATMKDYCFRRLRSDASRFEMGERSHESRYVSPR